LKNNNCSQATYFAGEEMAFVCKTKKKHFLSDRKIKENDQSFVFISHMLSTTWK
jgi:hypothetical protein